MTWMADPRRQRHRGPACRGDQPAGGGLNYHSGVERAPGSLAVRASGWGPATIRLSDGPLASVGPLAGASSGPGVALGVSASIATAADKALGPSRLVWAWIGKERATLIHRQSGLLVS